MKHRHLTGLLLVALLIAWAPAASAGWTHGGDAEDGTLVTTLRDRIERILGLRQAETPKRPTEAPRKTR